jgi:beta-mannosidase
MKPVTLGLRREVTKNRINDRPRNFYEYGSFQSRKVTLSIWACNSRHTESTYTLKISAYDIATNWQHSLLDQQVTLGENRSTELWSGACPEPPREKSYDQLAPSGTVVIHATLVASSGEVVARFSDWPQPYKFLEFPDPGLELKVGNDEITISVGKPVKGLWISVQGDDAGVEFGDNSLDLFPGDEQVVGVKGIEGKVITGSWLGKERADRIQVQARS